MCLLPLSLFVRHWHGNRMHKCDIGMHRYVTLTTPLWYFNVAAKNVFLADLVDLTECVYEITSDIVAV